MQPRGHGVGGWNMPSLFGESAGICWPMSHISTILSFSKRRMWTTTMSTPALPRRTWESTATRSPDSMTCLAVNDLSGSTLALSSIPRSSDSRSSGKYALWWRKSSAT